MTEKLNLLYSDETGMRIPREIAIITICGSMKFVVNEDMVFKQPTPEQIKNLRETFNIDVEIL
jgi:hypothetical protein